MGLRLLLCQLELSSVGPMLRRATAVQFVKPMSTGRNRPILLDCQLETGLRVSVVAKCASGECGVSGLVREALAAVLASDLGLPVTEPLIVDIPNELVDTIPATFAQVITDLSNSTVPAFGSKLIPPGYAVLPVGFRIPEACLDSAAAIFAFDALLLNVDRKVSNPNLQFNGKDFALFDHELALVVAAIGGLTPYPWSLNALGFLTQGPSEHVLYRALRGKDIDWAPIQTAWEAMSVDRSVAIAEALPAEWNCVEEVMEINRYIERLTENIPAAFAEVRRVLS
ncbi:MAG: HipA family kinase [Gammaproteobacteria bacterium]